MKFLTQVVLPILVVIGLIGGLTFLKQYSGSSGKKTPTTLPSLAGNDKSLLFPVERATWDAKDDPKSSPYVAEFELNSQGHYDFWFLNPTTAPVDLSYKYKSCTCAKLSVGLPTVRGKQQLMQTGTAVQLTAALAGMGGGMQPLAPVMAADRWLDRLLTEEFRWQALENANDPAVSVPAASDAESPALGVVRLDWVGKRPEPVLLVGQLWIRQSGRAPDEVHLEVPVVFVPALRVEPTTLRLRDITQKGQDEAVEFDCWSSTRAGFPLTAVEEKDDACVRCERRPLTTEERQTLADKLKTRVRSGYRVRVTVSERRDKDQLDLGPLQRKIVLTGPADQDKISVPLSGVVRGEVKLPAGGDKDQIDLQRFRAARGTTKMVLLTTDQAGLDLKLESWTPDYLKVQLELKAVAEGGRRWELVVTVPPGRVTGRLPPDSAVILQTQGEVSRRMRIPILGEGTQ